MRTILLLAGLLLSAPGLLAQGEVPEVRLEARAPDGVKRFAPQWRAPGQRSMALILRGGSAKGLAHIGVIQRFEEEGLPIDAVAGTSAGSMIGALYATGYSGRQVQAIFKAIDFGALLDDRRRTPGLTMAEEEIRNANALDLNLRESSWEFMPGRKRAARVQEMLRLLFAQTITLPEHDFDQLRIPLRTVATDLQTGDAYVFRKGEVAKAVRASMTIPALLAPVEQDGHQLVDGGFAENLPVHTGRREWPGLLQVGVDIGRTWDASRVHSVFAVGGRALDASMKQNEKRSLKEADVLISPAIDNAAEFDFHYQVDELVRLGREAFDRALPQLEAQLYGPGSEAAVATAPLRVGDSRIPGLDALIERSLPAQGPIRKVDLYRLLRRVQQTLPVREAWIELGPDPSGPATLRFRTEAVIQRIDWQLPADLPPGDLDECRRIAEASPLKAGQPFQPHDFEQLVWALTQRTPWTSQCLLSFKASTFDPTSGVLHLNAEEIRIRAIEVAPGRLKGPMEAFFKRITETRTSPGEFLRTLDNACVRFHVSDLGASTVESTPAGLVLKLDPKQDESVVLSFTPAYETNWGLHLGADMAFQNSWFPGITIGLHGAVNSLQTRGALTIEKELTTFPGFSFGLYGEGLKQSFGSDLFLVTTLPLEGGLDIHRNAFGLGLSHRFGTRDTGKFGLRVEQEHHDYKASTYDAPWEMDRTAQAFLEWDDLDLHTLPTKGTLFRIRGGASFQDASETQPFQFGYLRWTQLYTPPSLGLGFQFDLEGALGWHTPLPRWNILGGTDSIIGTKGAAYLIPNAGIMRLGLPFTSTLSAFGISMQVVPRVDYARLAAEPNELSGGSRVLGLGVMLRSIIQTLYVEVALGQTQTRVRDASSTEKNTEFTVLVGTRPFDLWKQR